MRKLVLVCLLSFFLATHAAHATIFSQVHGVVHDPQHRPIPGARIELHAANSAFTQTALTTQDGSFTIPSVPLGDYILSISQSGFATTQQTLTLASDTAPILHIELALSTIEQIATLCACGHERKWHSGKEKDSECVASTTGFQFCSCKRFKEHQFKNEEEIEMAKKSEKKK